MNPYSSLFGRRKLPVRIPRVRRIQTLRMQHWRRERDSPFHSLPSWSLIPGWAISFQSHPAPLSSLFGRRKLPVRIPRVRRIQTLRMQHWRRERDSNPRWACTHNGFQDRRHQPLGHLSPVKISEQTLKVPLILEFRTIFANLDTTWYR
jgi:hypothetical protein